MNDRPVHIAGLTRQIVILLWKNAILFRRNILGMLSEILCPFLFLSILLIMRHFIPRIEITDRVSPRSVLKIPMPELQEMNVETNRNKIFYYPNTKFIKDIIDRAAENIRINNPDFKPQVIGSNLPHAQKLDTNSILNMFGFISFPASYGSSLPNNVEYTIFTQELPMYKYNIGEIFANHLKYYYVSSPEMVCYNERSSFKLYKYFNVLKYAVDVELIDKLTGTRINNDNLIQTAPFKCPTHIRDDMISEFAFFIPIVIILAFLLTMIITVGNTVKEKASRMKGYLKLNGVKWQAIWIATWIRSMIFYTIFSIFIVILTKVEWNSGYPFMTSYKNKAVFMNTHFMVVFSLLFVYSIQVSIFNLLMTQFFSSQFNARVFYVFLWAFTSLNFYNSLPLVLKYFLCFFPNLGLTFGVQVILQYERSNKALTFSKLYTSLFKDALNIGGVMSAMLGCSLLYLVINWYLEKILPGEYGVPLPFYFPFTRSYWFPRNARINPQDNESNKTNQFAFEREPIGLKRTVAIQNISKTFKSFKTKKEAVKNLSLNLYEDQVTGIIGHNGAGKTTTTLMLCGLYPPTSGTANMMGYDLCYETDKIHSVLGFCPQYDILYDNLTVEEHFKLIALIKGYSLKNVSKEVSRIATLVGLGNDLKKKSANLSGGMKRRLMVGMAFTGDSKIIILDEPTSGLDPFNRLKFWELIRFYKKGRTIILTTHFMEEVDALSDRIGIMNHGQLVCCGTPLFLKNYYGTGFRVTIFKNERFSQSKLESILHKSLDDYNIEANVAGELCLSVPFGKSGIMSNVINSIEENKSLIGMDSYRVSSSTMEEVFLKVGKIDKQSETEQKMDAKNVDEKYFESMKNNGLIKHGSQLWQQQILTLLTKRLTIFYRRYILAATILLVPVLMQIILCVLIPSSSVLDTSIESSPIVDLGQVILNAHKYGNIQVPYEIVKKQNKKVNTEQILHDYYARRNTQIELKPTRNLSETVFIERTQNLAAIYEKNFLGVKLSNVADIIDLNSLEIVAYYSTMAYHSLGVILNEMSNFFLFTLTSDKEVAPKIITYNSPLSSNNSNYIGDDFIKYLGCFDILPYSVLNFVTAMIVAFIMSFIIMFVAKERITGSKSLQLISGTHQVTYWTTNYVFDYALCLYNVLLIVCVISLVGSVRSNSGIMSDVSILASWPEIGYVLLVLFLSSLTWPIYTYCWSFFFKSDITGFVVLFFVLCASAFADVLLSFVQLFTYITNQSLEAGAPLPTLMYILRILLSILFPNVTIKRQLFNLRLRSNNYCIDILNEQIKTNYNYNTPYANFLEPGIGIFLIILFFQFIASGLVFIALEMNMLNWEFIKRVIRQLLINNEKKLSSVYQVVEGDVEMEATRIKKADLEKISKREPLIVKGLAKVYKKGKVKFNAVDNLNFGIEQEQCFGLLGLNGAGKTSTFKMVIGESEPDSGDVIIDGFSVCKQRFKARKKLGYCPQFDSFPEYLTVAETLKIFSKLRGASSINILVEDMLNVFQLVEFERSLVQNLSGGNKRKLSSAIAFLCNPSVVILDEPSTGMDPGARKFLWNIIKKARNLGICVVLSSHSMEECEALCDKLGIMQSGQLQCFGSINHIKEKYGDGYQLIIKCNHTEQITFTTNRLEQFILNNLHNSILEDKQHETLFFKLKKSELNNEQSGHKVQRLSEVFSILETNKNLLDIESYLLSETTLEQIFMSFAKSTTTPTNNNADSMFTHFDLDSSLNLSRMDGAPNVLISCQATQSKESDKSKNVFDKFKHQFKKQDVYEVKF